MDRSLVTRTQARNGVSELQCRRTDELPCVKITVGRKRVLVSYCQNGAGNFLRIIDGRKRIHVPSQCFHRLVHSLNTLERVLKDYKGEYHKRDGDSLDVDATQNTLGQPKVVQEDVSEVPHPVASVATYEGRVRGVNPISVVTECDWHSKGCERPVNSDSHADPEG